MIYVLVIRKNGQINNELDSNLPQWKKILENKLNDKIDIGFINDTTNLHSAIKQGHLKKYLMIFTSYIEGDEIFDLLESQLKHTIIFRVKEKTISHPYTPKNENLKNKNVYPQFSVETLNLSVNTLVPIIRTKISERNQALHNPVMSSTDQPNEPSENLIEQLKKGTITFVDEEDNEVVVKEKSGNQKDLVNDELPGNESIPPKETSSIEIQNDCNINPLIENPQMDDKVEKEQVPKFHSKSNSKEIESRNQYETDNIVRKAPQSSNLTMVDNDSFVYERTRTIQKQLFAKQNWNNHKIIGIWSPLHRKGVTTFTINYALFLAENRIFTAVLEGLKKDVALKYWLKRYTQIPNNWSSYAKTIHSDIDPKNADWSYRNVLFLPLDDDDCLLEWNSEKIELYMKIPSLTDITLVDMPTGEMAPYTLDSLIFLDELWILVDDAFQEYKAWKEYIHLLRKKFKVEVKLIFNQTYEFSQTKRLAKEMELDMIATLPAMHKEVMHNYYETEPLIANPCVRKMLFDEFVKLIQYLIGNDVEIITKVEREVEHENLLQKIRRWLKIERIT